MAKFHVEFPKIPFVGRVPPYPNPPSSPLLGSLRSLALSGPTFLQDLASAHECYPQSHSRSLHVKWQVMENCTLVGLSQFKSVSRVTTLLFQLHGINFTIMYYKDE